MGAKNKEEQNPENDQTQPAKPQRPRIRIFKSHNEQRKEMYVYWASITPEKRIENMIDLIIMSFGLESDPLFYKNLEKKIKISSYKQ